MIDQFPLAARPQWPSHAFPPAVPVRPAFGGYGPQRSPFTSPHHAFFQQASASPANAAFTVPLQDIRKGVDYNGLLLGAAMGRGISKTAYPVLSPQTGQPTGQVMLVERNRFVPSIHEGLHEMNKLQQMGFPVAPVHSCGFYDGKAAMLMPRMEGVYSPIMLKLPGRMESFAQSPYINRETVRSLQVIQRQLQVHQIRVRDLQVLMNPATGRLYITDPMGIQQGVTSDHLLGRLLPNLLGHSTVIDTLLERLYLRFPDMRAYGMGAG